MNPRHFLSAFFLGALSFVLVSQSAYTPPRPSQLAAPGSESDPNARWRYEFERLKDPKTGEIPANIRKLELEFAGTLPSRERMTQSYKGSATQSTDWQFRGPENLGGRTRALAVDVANENVVIAGGVSGGMWRSEDKGATWSRASKLSDLKSVTCLVQDKREGMNHIWYYGTGEARANSAGLRAEYYGDGLAKSTDNGKSWTPLEATVSRTPHRFDDFDQIMSLAVDASNLEQDEVYCATTRAVYRSVDGGNDWDLVLGSSGGRGAYCEVYATPSGVMYASIHSSSTSAGLYRSTDGLKWNNITPPELSLEFERVVIAASPIDEDQVYFLLSTPAGGINGNSFFKYQYISGDGSGNGGAWENRTQFLPAELQTYYSYCMALQVHQTNPNIVYLGGMDLYRSTDGFASTSKTKRIGGNGYPTQHADQHVIALVPGKPNVAYSGNDGGIYRTDNINSTSVNWKDCNQGYVTSQFYTVAVDKDNSGSDLVMGGLQDNGTWISQTGTKNWQNLWGADGGYSKIVDGGNAVFASWQQGVIYRLGRDGNGAVNSFDRIDPSGAWNYDFINPFAVDPNDANMLYVAEGQSIWRTTEALSMSSGSNEPITFGWTRFTAAANQQVTTLSVSKDPTDILYYGTRNGRIFRVENASDPESLPVEISLGAQLPAGFVSAISIDPLDANKLLVSFSNYGIQSIACTGNAGENWSIVAGNLEQNIDGTGNGPAVKWVATLPTARETIYFAGTTTGLYSTDKLDGANTVWIQEAESVIGNTVIDMIDVRHEDGFVAVATHGNGIYSAYVNISGVKDVAQSPSVTSLSLNITPNPSSSLSRIGFELKQHSTVAISIVDAMGKTVFAHREELPAGSQAFRWNGLDQFNRPLPSGSYTVLIRTPYGEERKQLVRVK